MVPRLCLTPWSSLFLAFPHQRTAVPFTLRTDGLTLAPSPFNSVMGWLSVRERNRVAASSTKSAADVANLYEAVRLGGGKVFNDEQMSNYFDIQDVKLTEPQFEQLMAGELVPSGRWCKPTGVTFAGFDGEGEGEEVDLTRELPGCLADVLSRLVVLRSGFRRKDFRLRGLIAGPLAALVPRLPADRIRVLDLAHCDGLTGQLYGRGVFGVWVQLVVRPQGNT